MHSFIASSLLATSVIAGCGAERLDDITAFSLEQNPRSEVRTEHDGHIVVQAHGECVNDVAFTPDGKQIATCSNEGTVRIWDAQTGGYVRGFRTEGYVLALTFSPDGRHLFVTTIDHGIHVLDTITWKSSVVAKTDDQPQVIIHSENGELVAVGSSPIELFRPVDFKQIGVLRGHEQGGDTLAFSNDGKTLVSGNADSSAKVWDVEKQRLRFERKHDHWVGGVDVSPDGRRIATSSFKRDKSSQTVVITLIDSTTGKLEGTLIGETLRGTIHSDTRIQYSPDGRFLISLLRGVHDTGQIRDDIIITEDEGNISIWDVNTKRLLAKSTENRELYRLDVSSDSKTIAVADVNGILEIWDFGSFIRKHQVRE